VAGAALCGDLNVEAGSDEYRAMMIALGNTPDLLNRDGIGGDRGTA